MLKHKKRPFHLFTSFRLKTKLKPPFKNFYSAIMPTSLQFISKTIPGYGPPDIRCLPCSGLPRRKMSISQYSSPCNHILVSDIKLSSLTHTSNSSRTSSVCNASPNNYRRSPDFSRQNRQNFSRNRNNRNNEDKDSYDEIEESESFSNKNGSVVSFSGNHKFQATSTPGPREKEIVELFRKVQAQLRERAAKKEDKKVDDSEGKSKENDTVDSLLKLLRKHSVQQGKKNSNSFNNRDFILDHAEQVSPPTKEKRANVPDSVNSVKPEIKEIPIPSISRPKSNFQKRSPVPEVKFQPVYTKATSNSDLQERLLGKDIDLDLDSESDSESDTESLLPEGEVFDELLEDEPSEIYDNENNEAEEETAAELVDLSGMKLTELRAVAKSRGMKGFSKLKKSELLDMLSGASI